MVVELPLCDVTEYFVQSIISSKSLWLYRRKHFLQCDIKGVELQSKVSKAIQETLKILKQTRWLLQ